MRFSVDAHAIGCHLTGNEVYIRNLLKGHPLEHFEMHHFALLRRQRSKRFVNSGTELGISGRPVNRLDQRSTADGDGRQDTGNAMRRVHPNGLTPVIACIG